ncbi:class I SAM-dependent methyltransferase [Paenibacillus puerhi]|uniref:class I SAM-dependent methyltransferase n=1 Tax=Paenibacillus puerhi TaxID=2692622 RepID=UPI00135CCC0B|nr:class I SAM-dependent methyltransferase [Paenibacillus puerhi]
MIIKRDTDNFLHTNPLLYSAFYGEHDQGMAQFLHTLFIEYRTGKKVLDIGSGLGREVAYLNRAGYAAVGLDYSEDMIAWAREHYPGMTFVHGNQSDFSLQQQFDALYCVGSTFLYNYTNEEVLASLQCFRKHLHEGGLLYLDMRNAAFFLTREGQRWLTEEMVEQRKVNDTVITLRTRFSIDLAGQMLERDYCWTVTGYKPVMEHLRHRLLFPQELIQYLTSSGFRLLKLFDQPAPHVNSIDRSQPLAYSHDMLGTRMQVIAQAV